MLINVRYIIVIITLVMVEITSPHIMDGYSCTHDQFHSFYIYRMLQLYTGTKYRLKDIDRLNQYMKILISVEVRSFASNSRILKCCSFFHAIKTRNEALKEQY